MKVKVLERFKDKYTGEIHEADKVMDVTKERFEEILTVGKFVEEIVEKVAEESETEEAPKKRAAKKSRKSAE